MKNDVVLRVRDLSVSYLAERGRVQAVNHVSLDLRAGETLALIGESGCGKSTLNLALMGQLPSTGRVDSGEILYHTRRGTMIDILKLTPEEMRRFRWAEMSMVFQGALNSLNPVLRVSNVVYDTAAAHGLSERRALDRILERFQQVRLDPYRVFHAYPHELSGGMRQRVLLALSLLLEPQIVIMDEPTTAVDILTQRSILDVLKDLRQKLGFSNIFISHDLAVAAEIADTIATMYAGDLVEVGPVNDIFYQPRHAYTLSLLNAVPRLSEGHKDLTSIPGSPPDLIVPPSGCKFHPRCAFATEVCHMVIPPLVEYTPGHIAACHHADKVLAAAQERPA